jgi:hypothetical protein
MTDVQLRLQRHQADLEAIRQRQRDWWEREQRAQAARDAEDRERTEQHLAAQQRQLEQQQAIQRAWTDRLHELQAHHDGYAAIAADASSRRDAAQQQGDYASAVDGEMRRLAAESLRAQRDADLTQHKRYR